MVGGWPGSKNEFVTLHGLWMTPSGGGMVVFSPPHIQTNICIIRDKIFDYSASLISKIDALITSKSVPCDGPSSDDFSLSDAIRNVSREVP